MGKELGIPRFAVFLEKPTDTLALDFRLARKVYRQNPVPDASNHKPGPVSDDRLTCSAGDGGLDGGVLGIGQS